MDFVSAKSIISHVGLDRVIVLLPATLQGDILGILVNLSSQVLHKSELQKAQGTMSG